MNYNALHINISPDFSDILIAELGELGFETFEETNKGFNAFIPENLFDEQALVDLKIRYEAVFDWTYQLENIAAQNWNEVWEANFEPIVVADKCLIRSSFHQVAQKYPYEIIINPKMSFGTGHHATTALMIAHQLNINHQAKNVLDAGCGTGILAIMASKLGANKVIAYDIEEWAVKNGEENIEMNHCPNIEISQNTIQSIVLKDDFDIILANINKNVLLAEISSYCHYLKKGGILLLSGFYENDIADILTVCAQNNLILSNQKAQNDWAALELKKL